MIFFLFLAFADIDSDLNIASNTKLDQTTRSAAFSRLVSQAEKDSSKLRSIAHDTSQEVLQRWIAIRVLGRIGGRQITDHILPLLEDPKSDIRIAACAALGEIRSWYTGTPIRKLLKDDVLLVRVAAAQALGQLADPAAIEDLGEAIYDERHFHRGKGLWVRIHFVEALGKIRDRKSYPILFKTLDDSDPKIRKATLRALEQIAGMSLSEGRSSAEEREAWKRWLSVQLSK